ncbi:hypothetical protein MFUR16E_01345 [Methylobacterium fujisawaense]|uniref:hypothetical protein n=1 Tax=Methylobacterium fujisawaense TaxID=107400 RepID=UPI002F304C63
MQSPDERSRTTFGKRRTGEAAPGRDVLLQLSLDPSVVSVRRGPVSDIPNALTLDLQTQAGIVRLIALRDECQMTAQAEQAGLVPVHRSTFLRATPGTAVATAALAPMAEPETTGAIAAARSARTTRLDPCVAPAGDRLRP